MEHSGNLKHFTELNFKERSANLPLSESTHKEKSSGILKINFFRIRNMILIFILAGMYFPSKAQYENPEVIKIKLSQDYSNLSWNRFVSKVEENFPVHFFYQQEDIPDFQISFNSDSIILKDLYEEIPIQRQMLLLR